MCFATLTPPTPSRLAAAQRRASAGGNGGPRTASAAPQFRSMPDEYMRGGGCFGPNATVLVARDGDGGAPAQRVRVSDVRAGDRVVCDGGRAVTVKCVVMTECAGGRARLTRLRNGLEITEWHPLLNGATGRWQFPVVLGQQVLVATSYVYNFVTAERVDAILVDGHLCAALGHGIDAPIVGHAYWGTRAVIDDLATKPGWEAGRVVLPAGSPEAWAA